MNRQIAPALSLSGLTYSYAPSRTAIHDVSLDVPCGEMLGVIGPNGSGKSTLMKLISGYLTPSTGRVRLFGLDVRQTPRRMVARQMAVVAQAADIHQPFTVHELIQMGSYAWNEPLSEEAENCILESMNIAGLEDRVATELSGGERQRVLLAQALAQRPMVLLLDEPTTYLDLRHQIDVLDHVRALRQKKGMTVLIVLHDLNLAATYCDRLLLLRDGRVIQDGPPSAVLTEENIGSVFGVEAAVTTTANGKPRVVLFPSGVRREPSSEAPSVHVVGGGGSAAALMQELAACGYRVSLAPVNAGDADQRMADRLRIQYHSAAPFSPLDAECRRAQDKAIRQADLTVLCPVPFGIGNIANLEGLVEAAEDGRRIISVEDDTVRDFTGGAAARLLDELRSKAVIVRSETEALDAVKKTLPFDRIR